jgi:cytochrome c-type biogenesis protein CcmH
MTGLAVAAGRLTAILALCLTLCLGLKSQPVQAQIAQAPGAAPLALDAAGESRYKQLSEELRCLVCQNQTLADSNAELAVDLRNQVRDQIAQGRSDTQIKDYLVSRYGDFVLYRPPVQGNTTALWFGPFVLLGLGVLVWAVVSRRSRQPGATAPTQKPSATTMSGADARKLLDD